MTEEEMQRLTMDMRELARKRSAELGIQKLGAVVILVDDEGNVRLGHNLIGDTLERILSSALRHCDDPARPLPERN